MKKFVAATVLLATLAPVTHSAFANAETSSTDKVVNKGQQQVQKTWLGVSLTSVPTVLTKQLGSLIPENQGVMIRSVMPDSPAARAGLQAYDILLSFNDQQLYSPQQLAGLVAASKADSEVTLGLIRNATKQTAKVTLKGHAVADKAYQRHPAFGSNGQAMSPPAFPDFWSQPFATPNFGGSFFTRPIFPQGMNPPKSLGQANVMQQFESINIRSIDGDRFHAEVEYQENGGEKKKFTFEGKYDEIREQIKSNKELPESKKNSLLNALKNNPDQLLPNGFMGFPQFPAFPAMPSFNHNLNQAPLWFNNGSKI